MSSAVSTAITVAEPNPTVEKVPKKFPPPCWTQEETLCLIEAYRERWYALRRGYLRTPDWDDVATTVSSQFPDVSPAKTSAQCRHKMEKLRQRYRAEKQRALSYPYPAGRYFSSWFFFDYMEAMENGTTVQTSAQKAEEGSRLKSFIDDSILKLKIREKSEVESSTPGFGVENGVRGKRSKISYMDVENVAKKEEDVVDHAMFVNMNRRNLMSGVSTHPMNPRARMFDSFDESGGGFRQQMVPPESRFKKSDRRQEFYNRGSNPNEEMWSNNVPNARSNYWENSNPRGEKVNGSSKRGRNAMEEMADSIRLLGEGFVKMERAKMEMAREMETMRMEMEMKRNEMLLESQKQIVDAFVKGLFEMKANKKVKGGVGAADSAGT